MYKDNADSGQLYLGGHMRIGIIGDVHFCQYSSIVRRRGEKYSVRLENCINSINWAEQLTSNCDGVVYVGDFFDNATLNAEEISALQEITWNNKPHKLLVGNHEMGINNLDYSSAHLFNLCPGLEIINKPYVEIAEDNSCTFAYLPYVLHPDKRIEEYFSEYEIRPFDNVVTFSHNDIKGLQLGQFVSEDGFEIKDIRSFCQMYINGHIHNGGKVEEGVINIGNLTGQNFSEDALIYDHTIIILDTETLKCEVYENPYAFNFYKLDATESDIDFNVFKNNSVLSLKTYFDDVQKYREAIEVSPQIVESRLTIVMPETEGDASVAEETFSVDHIKQFNDYVLEALGNNDIVREELAEVLK